MPIRVIALHDLIDMPKDKKPEMLKIMAVADKERLDKIQKNIPKSLTDKLNPIRSEPVYLDFTAPNVDKGWALKQLSEYLHLSPNEVMALGNADNDIPMIQFAGTGVAMEESTPNLLKVADYQTTSNNVDGIVKAIQKLVLEDY